MNTFSMKINFKLLFNSLLLFSLIFINNFVLNSCALQKSLSLKGGKAKGIGGAKRKGDTTISKKLPKHDIDWHYGENWAKHHFGDCGKKSQSPIRLMTSSAVEESLDLKLTNYDKPIKLAYIENNGHTVQIGFSDKFKASVSGSVTNGKVFIFNHLHFHWGSYNGVGSEHTIDGFRGPMEGHFVHYNSEYKTFDNAFDKADGLLVFGIIFKISSRNNGFMSSIIKLVKDVPKYEDKAMILETMRLRSLLPTNLKPFFTYPGSLTVPPCFETVQWIVFKRTVNIGQQQEKQFRKCRGEVVNERTGRKRTLSNNFRPIQAINERQIIISS